MKNYEKYEELFFKPKIEKIELLKDYARKNGIRLEMVANIPKSAWVDFDRFLIENDILEDDINEE